MSGTGMVLLIAVLGGWAGEPAPSQRRNTASTDAAAQDVRAQVEKTMRAFVAKDLEGFQAGLAEDVVGFEMDLESKPVRLVSRTDAVRYAKEMFAQLIKIGVSMTLDIHANDCRATSTLAYCTVEFDFQAKMADGSTVMQPSRNTVVLRKSADSWKWTHWHSSLAVIAAPPALPNAP